MFTTPSIQSVLMALTLHYSHPLLAAINWMVSVGVFSTVVSNIENTVYREIFVSLNFHEFHEFCSVTNLNFAKYCHAALFMLPHGSFAKIFFMKLLKLPFSQKFPGIRYLIHDFVCAT